MNQRKVGVFFVGAAIVLTCIVGAWWLLARKQGTTTPVTVVGSNPVTNLENHKIDLPAKADAGTTEVTTAWDWTNQVPAEQREAFIERTKKMSQIAAAANVPMVFYGKILDQHNEPVVGVRIQAAYNSWGLAGIATQRPSRATNYFESDAQGNLFINGIKGSSLTVYLEKEGYEPAPHNPHTFGYGYGSPETHTPNPAKPVLFQMWKRQGGAELQSGGNKGLIPSDGTSVWLDTQAPRWSRTLIGDAFLKVTADRNRRMVTFTDKTPYDWSLEIESPNGGIQLMNEVFPYLAPDAGYNSKLTISYSANDPDWRREQSLRFYFKTQQGFYGHGEVLISNWENNADMYCRLTFTLNPAGDRNLEPQSE